MERSESRDGSKLRVRRLGVVFVMAMVLSGCGWLASYRDYTKVSPASAHLIGTWIPNKETLKEMSDRGHYDISVVPTLALRDDGTFLIEHMPDWWNNGRGESHGGFYTYSGRWKPEKEKDSGRYILRLEFANSLTSMSLLGQKPPYEIFFFIGDADSGNSMTFVRQ